MNLTQLIKQEALRLGFSAIGVVSQKALHSREGDLAQWLKRGQSGGLAYMDSFFERRDRFLASFPTLTSLIILAAPYSSESPPSKDSTMPSGKIARYAWGRNYHKVLQKRLKQLGQFLETHAGKPVQTRFSVDTAPLQERALAEAAGLGFFGKNGCLIRPGEGSYFFLAALGTNLPLDTDEPLHWDCGQCALCIKACPTDALHQPYQVDASRCISNLTIEQRGSIDPSLASLMGDWIFGCDVCQEVCPYNKKGAPVPWDEFVPTAGAGETLSLQEILGIQSEEVFLERFAGTPLMRAKREGLLRNAAIAAGNSQDPHLIQALTHALHGDPSPLVRDSAAWALSKISATVNSNFI